MHYEVEATVLGELGEPIVAERQENTKRIKLKTLSENTNIPRLAEEILDKCKLIHASKLSQVEGLLRDLVQERGRRERSAGGAGAGGAAERKKSKKKDRNGGGGGGGGGSGQTDETPSLDQLDRYVEMMYDDPETATQATYLILQLARSPENLEQLLENEALLGLLARLLQEEGPKSMDLAINILYILYAFSNFSQFHPALYQARVGNYVLSVIELENKRHRVREHERAKNNGGGGDPRNPEEKEKEKRYRMMVRKQEKLLYVCFHVLLNLAEEPDIERKMAKKGIVNVLVGMLNRSNPELLVLVLLFLMKLAIFKENLPALREKEGGKKDKNALPVLLTALQSFVPHNTEPLCATALRLLFNLSFDQTLRGHVVNPNSGFLQKLSSLLRRKMQLPLVLRLLYNISAETEARKAIGQTEIPRVVMKHVLNCQEPQLPLELAALAINLASEGVGAQAMADNGNAVRLLVDKLYASHDLHITKLLRNLAMHSSVSEYLLPFVADLIALCQQVDTPELMVEMLGIIGGLPLGQLPDIPMLNDKYNLIEFLARYLTPGFTEDDVLLEVIVVFGSLAANPECASRISQSRVLSALYSIITEKQEDDEIVLQILYAFFHLLQANEPRFALLQQTQLVVYLLDLLLDKNESIRKMSSLCLDVVIEKDDTWAPQIRQRKFQMHNKEWLEVVDEDEAEEYQDAVALNNAMASLHQQPLDASALQDAGGLGEEDDLEDSYDVPQTPGTYESYGDVAAGGYASGITGVGGGMGAATYGGGGYGGVGDPYGASDDYNSGLSAGNRQLAGSPAFADEMYPEDDEDEMPGGNMWNRPSGGGGGAYGAGGRGGYGDRDAMIRDGGYSTGGGRDGGYDDMESPGGDSAYDGQGDGGPQYGDYGRDDGGYGGGGGGGYGGDAGGGYGRQTYDEPNDYDENSGDFDEEEDDGGYGGGEYGGGMRSRY